MTLQTRTVRALKISARLLSGMRRAGNGIVGNRARTSRPRPEAGFTLLEILVVVAILGLLIGLVAPAALRQLSGARNSIAKQSIERISGK